MLCNRCQFEDEGVNCMLEEDDGFLGPAKADPLPWDVLDNGADQTGAQMQLLTPFISGQVRFRVRPTPQCDLCC